MQKSAPPLAVVHVAEIMHRSVGKKELSSPLTSTSNNISMSSTIRFDEQVGPWYLFEFALQQGMNWAIHEVGFIHFSPPV